MAVEKLITEHIDTWTSALKTRSTAGRGSNGKIDLYGIKKLRELILELAVRGKLVPQDPNDEPASELLKRITAEKTELVKQGKIKKQKPLPPMSDEDKPFRLPEGWEWCQLQTITSKITDGDHKTPARISDGYKLLSAKNVRDGYLDYDNCDCISEMDYIKSRERCLPEIGDLLMVSVGGTIGRSSLIRENADFALVRSVAIIKPLLFNPNYLKFSMDSFLLQGFINETKRGGAQPCLYLSEITKFIFPMPPEKEQKRIVCKVNEIMSLCDQLEQQSLTSLAAHSQLVETLLATLTESKNAEELAESWARISQHFDTLFTTEASIDALKQTILQLAVMGKLVPQDPNDEPASELLKRIAQEKAQLVKEGKIKKQKPLPPISDEEKPFELPVGWEWCRLGECIHLISGQHLKPDEYSKSEIVGSIPYITGPAEFGVESPIFTKYTTERRAVAYTNDILITCKGAGLGKLNVSDREMAISRQLMAVRPIYTDSDYFKLVLMSMYDYFQNKGVGIAIPGISREDVIEPIISIPPLKEQRAIVYFVNDIYKKIMNLKSRLQSAQQTQLHLADALTDAALN
jgi:type I restriction enzyme S subunit